MVKKERVLPHDLDAERSVLGGILIDDRQLQVASSKLSPESFLRAAHGAVFACMLRLSKAESAIDLRTVVSDLMRSGELDDVGGPAYVSALVDGVPKSINVEHYAEVVAEYARLRALILEAKEISDRAYQGGTAGDIVAKSLPRMVRLVPERGTLILADDAIREYYGEVVGGTLPAPVSTGHVDLDEYLDGGLRPGDLAIIAARPSMGKTAFALGVADHMARVQGQRAIFFSIEMGQRKIAARLLTLRSRVASARVSRGDVTVDEAQRVSDAVDGEPSPLLLEFAARSVAEIDAWCEKVISLHGDLACVAVDYIQLLSSGRARSSDEAEMAEISRDLKAVAKRRNTVMLALSQLNRAPEAKKDKRPSLSDLRGSGALEQDCDVCMLLFRDAKAEAEHEGQAEVIIAKNRDGAKGVVRMAFVEHLAMFSDLAAAENR